jgi:hypothetical protein
MFQMGLQNAPFVNSEDPATVSTIIRRSCRKDKVAESPMYRTRPVGSCSILL